MKTCLVLIIAIMVMAGCVSPYRTQAQAMQAAYQRGEITADQFYSGISQLEALELQRRQAVSQAFFQAGANVQRQEAINQLNRPQSIYLYNMGR